MLRALVPSNQIITYANGQMLEYMGASKINCGADVYIGGIKFDRDHVTDARLKEHETSLTWSVNHIVPGTVFPVVQFLTGRRVFSGLVAGDSHFQGTGTTGHFRNFAFVATGRHNRLHRNERPVGMVNAAIGGHRSTRFFARSNSLLDAVNPGFMILPGWTYNDVIDNVHAGEHACRVYLSRLFGQLEVCAQNKIVPVVLTPFPRDKQSMMEEQVRWWRWLRGKILDLSHEGVQIIDAAALLGSLTDGEFDGTYLSQYSNDSVHPNDLGHEILAQELEKVLQAML